MATEQQSGIARGQSARWFRLWTAIGLVALALWTAWWYVSWRRNVLFNVESTWIMGWRFLGLDFFNNYLASRHWLAGGDAYRDAIGDPLGRAYCYPPLVLPTFAWCTWFSPQRAMHIFLVVLTSVVGLGVWCASRTRRELELVPIPYTILLAAVLFSTPVLYALERGNFDLLVLPPLLLAAWSLRERSWTRDGLAGTCLAFAAGIKVYPALLILGLIPLRRFRALVLCGMAGLLFLTFHFADYASFRVNAAALVAQNDPHVTHFLGWTMHSLSATWPLLVEPLGFESLGRLPGLIAASLLLGPILITSGIWLYRCPKCEELILPYFLWLTATATFFVPVANDYSLVFLPLAVIALWDRRDRLLVHLSLAYFLLCWQPWQLDVGPRLLLVGKVAAIWAMGISLIDRARERNERTALEWNAKIVIKLPRAA